MPRCRVLILTTTLIATGSTCPVARAQLLAVSVKNQINLATSSTDQLGAPFAVTGLSGLAHITGSRWIAVMDNSDTASITSGIRLSQSHDHEDIVYTGPARDTVLVAEEDTPAVREYSLELGTLGQQLQVLPVPAVFANRRANFGFEALSLRTPGTDLWTCNEEALSVDGPLSTPSAGTIVRLLRYSFTGGIGTPGPEYAYLTDPIHAPNTSGARSGVSALVALPSGRLLALERSFGFSLVSPFQSRLYEVTLAGATDISGLPGLIGQSFTPASKRSMFTGNLTNMEGLALGPPLPGGGYALLGIVDDGDPISINRLVAFVLTGPVAATPCAVDADNDGVVTPADVATFVTNWFQSLAIGTLAGDFDGNGLVQPADVAAFVAAWAAALISGC